ncbi:MAG: sulfurtransferase complex subunit TusB [Magnetococcales bacterium]|nr:sulfurtransferase complex subunit TusB [Magnetococcales bacterium]
MLHTVNKSPFGNGSLESCLRFMNAGDVLLLLEDGVNGAIAGTSMVGLIEQAMAKNEVYAISADLKARGLTNLIPGIKVIDYAGFVDLVEKHTTHAWL